MTHVIRIVLADDHPIVLAGMRSLLDAEGDLQVVGEATDGAVAIKQVAEHQPDVAIVDISIAAINGIVLTRRIVAEMPRTRVIVLTLHEDSVYIAQALEAGASGYVVKRSAADVLVTAVRAVHNGGIYIDPAIAHRIVKRPTSKGTRVSVAATKALSDRETEVLKLSSVGMTNKEIASRIGVSVKSVETFKSRGLGKLDIRTRSDLLRHASRNGWLSDI
jgi:DNA-binding NarL/FixJ family response regulator